MAAIDLTTVSRVLSWMPAPASAPSAAVQATQTAVLQAAITAASLDFLRRTGRGPQNSAVPAQSPFCEAIQYSETYDGSGTVRQFLRNWPIISVESLTVEGAVILASSGYPSPGYVIDGSGKSISLIGAANGYPVTYRSPRCGWKFPMGSQNVSITYTAGFAAQAVTNELQTIPASSPYTITPQSPWLSDGGVKYFSGGTPLAAVQTAPSQGQYYIDNGTYMFNAADAGKQVQLSYSATGTPADIELTVRKVVYRVYLRRSWEGLRSLSKPESGTTSYTLFEYSPEDLAVVDNYARKAIV